jgi:hypothetical protein
VEVYMIARMIVTGLVSLSLSSILLFHSSGRAPTPQTTPANVQQPQTANSSKELRIFIEEDFSTAQMLKRELAYWSSRIDRPIIFVEKDVDPYDLRILLASDAGSDSDSCSSHCSCSNVGSSTDLSCSCWATPSSPSCSVTITLHFVSASALAPDGKLQFTETGVGSAKRDSITPLARKLAKRLSVLPYAKSTPAK